MGLLADREAEPRGAVDLPIEGAGLLAGLWAREFERGAYPPRREAERLEAALVREFERGTYRPELAGREETRLDELRGEMLVARLDLPGEIFVARLVARLPDPPEIRELVRGANLGEAEPAPEPKLERGPDDVRVRGEALPPELPPRGETLGAALGAGLLRGAARGLLLGAGLDDLDLTLGARWTGAGEEGLELFSIRERPELGAGREMPELLREGELADGTREELRPTGSLPRLIREVDPPEEPAERDVAVERVSRPPKRRQPSFPLLELEPDDRTEDGEFSPRLLERTEVLPEGPFAPLVSVPALVPSRRFWLNRPRSLSPRTSAPALDSVPAEVAPREPSRPLGVELPPVEPRAVLCPRTLPGSPLFSPAPPRTTVRPEELPRVVPPATAPPRTDPDSRRCDDSLKALTD